MIDTDAIAHRQELQQYRNQVRDAVKAQKAAEADRDRAILYRGKAEKVKPFHIKVPIKKGHQATACTILSDTHIEEHVRLDSVNGLNEHNLQISRQRFGNYWKNLIKLVHLHQNHVKINELVVFALGDFITNYLHEDNVESALLPPIDALVLVTQFIRSGIEAVLEHTDVKVRLVFQCGNHGRFTPKMRSYNRNGTNLEYYMAHQFADWYEDNPRVHVVLPAGIHTYVQIYDRTIRAMHGDEGFPASEVGRQKALARWNVERHADMTVFGHFHTLQMGPNYIGNGSLIGTTAWSYPKFGHQAPCQAFWLEDAKYSKALGPTQFTPIAV